MDIRAMIVKRDVEHLSKRQIAKDMKISRDQEEEIDDSCGIIHIVPAWKWFLGR